MLDNAIREAAASGAADPSVEVRARLAAGYLVVKVKTDWSENPKELKKFGYLIEDQD